MIVVDIYDILPLVTFDFQYGFEKRDTIISDITGYDSVLKLGPEEWRLG